MIKKSLVIKDLLQIKTRNILLFDVPTGQGCVGLMLNLIVNLYQKNPKLKTNWMCPAKILLESTRTQLLKSLENSKSAMLEGLRMDLKTNLMINLAMQKSIDAYHPDIAIFNECLNVAGPQKYSPTFAVVIYSSKILKLFNEHLDLSPLRSHLKLERNVDAKELEKLLNG
jgi:hypothetical protein